MSSCRYFSQIRLNPSDSRDHGALLCAARGLIRRNKSYVFNQSVTKTALATLLLGASSNLFAFGDQWFLGVGGGLSRLQPDPTDQSVTRDEENGNTTVIYFGRDFDDRSSGQVQLYSLGDADLSNGATVGYTAGDASVLYRFFDTRDARPDTPLAASLYGRFGFGFIDREGSQELTNDVPIFFGAGAGVETYFTHTLGLRLEAMFHEADTASASLSLVGRFGGRPKLAKLPPTLPAQSNDAEALPASESDAGSTPPPIRQPSLEIPKPTTANQPTPADTLPGTAAVPADVVPEPSSTPEAADVQAPAPDPDSLPEVWQGELPETEPESVTDAATAEPDVEPELPSTPATESIGDIADEPTGELTDEPTGKPIGEPSPDAQETVAADDGTALPDPDDSDEVTIPNVEIMSQDIETMDTDSLQDLDNDGVANSSDQCPDSTAGYPVDISGCPLFSSLARQLVFADGSDKLTSAAIAALNRLAVLLKQYPDARIEIVAHTHNSGDEEAQSDLTRRRLRAMGLYLVKEGITQDRLLLRSYGGKRPIYGNSTAEGRRANNRVEILENP